MSNYHMNMEAMRKYQPEKAKLMDEIFGYRIHGGAKPTYNITSHELSDTITHAHKGWEYIHTDEFKSWYSNSYYICERNAIVESCENHHTAWNEYTNPGFYIFVEDLDISVLKAIKYEIGNTSYYDWLKGKKGQEQKKIEAIKAPLLAELEEEKAKRIELENKISAIQAFLNK